MTIQAFIPVDTGLTVYVADNSANPVGCNTSTWLHIATTDANFDLISSTLLTAFTQGKPVKVWQSSCQTDGSVRFTAAWVDK